MRKAATADTLIEDIYDAGLDAGHWPVVLERLARTFGSGSAHLSVDVAGRGGGGAAEPRMVAWGTDPAWCRRYGEYYAARNLFWDRIVERSLSGVMVNYMIVSKDEARRSEFYNDYLHPQGGDEILCFVAAQHGRSGTSFTLWRAEQAGHWQRDDIRRLTRLAPHLKRAVVLNSRLGQAERASRLTVEALSCLDDGIILTDRDGYAHFVNAAAEAMFADGGGLRLEDRRVAAARPQDSALVRGLIARAARERSGGSLVIAREARPPLVLLAAPLRPEAGPDAPDGGGAMLVVKDMERQAARSLAAFARHFGLTPAQAALAHELIAGDGVDAAAGRLGLSRATVRTHLVRLFQKTGTRRQAELVRLMLEWSDSAARFGNDNGVSSSRR